MNHFKKKVPIWQEIGWKSQEKRVPVEATRMQFKMTKRILKLKSQKDDLHATNRGIVTIKQKVNVN